MTIAVCVWHFRHSFVVTQKMDLLFIDPRVLCNLLYIYAMSYGGVVLRVYAPNRQRQQKVRPRMRVIKYDRLRVKVGFCKSKFIAGVVQW